MVEVVVTTAAKRSAKQQSNRHHQQTNTQLFTVYDLFVAQPTLLKHLREQVSHSMDLLTPSSLAVFQPCLWPL